MKPFWQSKTTQNQAGVAVFILMIVGVIRTMKPDLVPWGQSDDEGLLNNIVTLSAAAGGIFVFLSRIVARLRGHTSGLSEAELEAAKAAAQTAFLKEMHEKAAANRAAKEKESVT